MDRLAHDLSCRIDKGKTAPSTNPWKAQLSWRSAVYVIQHLEKACHILADSRDKDPGLAPRLSTIIGDIHDSVLRPIYRTHPDLEATGVPPLHAQGLFRASPKDIRRATAKRITSELTRLQRNISKLGSETIDHIPDKSEAEKALQLFIDAAAELSFANKIAFDAYPDLFEKLFKDIPYELRTDESDAAFRKNAPPLGSVRLSDSALAFVKSFMQQVHRIAPKDDQVPCIGWVTSQKKKGPADTNWIEEGAGWELGAYLRTQVPPDVIDKVGDIEIVFSAEDPSSLKGKIIDVKNRKLFVRE
jgi:hypothetical protein